ncbi:MAG TPA: hypothetical protein VM367_02390 [Pseudonocardia sp.]|nr:hypothetical protein [Pseudonocardia sp.]
MAQLSLFSADARAALPTDLDGLLCGPAQIVRFGAGETARLSVVLAEPGRAPALLATCGAVGVEMETAATEDGRTVVRTAFRRDLVGLARRWTHGAVKAVPAGFQLDGPVLRMWALAAGRTDPRGGYLLELDPRAPATHLPLVAAATRAGVAPARVGGGGRPGRAPALRIGGTRRVRRLVELVGPPPAGVAPADWPRGWGRDAG